MGVLPLRGWVRVRETHLRDGLAPLLSSGDWGAAALDLLLRAAATATFPTAADDAGSHTDHDDATRGLIDPDLPWEALHDLLRPAGYRDADGVLKRNWIGGKLAKLENAGLVARDMAPGRRPLLWVLSDAGNGQLVDDPGAIGERYVTILSSVFRNQAAREWGAPEWTAYLAALVAERYSRADESMASFNSGERLGNGIWFRPLTWFADPEGLRPEHHVRIPFSERTLRRGTKTLREQRWMASRRIWADPRTGAPFADGTSKLLYFNGFADMAPFRGPGRAQRRAWRYDDPGREGRPRRASARHDGPTAMRPATSAQ